MIGLPLLNVSPGLATQGQSLFDNWVTSYTLAFSLNHTHWVPYMENHVIKVMLHGSYNKTHLKYDFGI